MPPLPIVLVHGAWHGAWCWSAVQAELDRRGLPSYAVDLPGHGASTLPLGDLHGDAAHVAASIDALDRDVVLVGHSYGGAVISEASVRTGRARHLVYLTAFVPAAGQSLLDRLQSMPPIHTPLSDAVVAHEDGTSTVDPDGAALAFYGLCPPEVAAAAIARLCPQPLATFRQPTTGAGWTSIPSTYVCCDADQAIPMEHQRAMAASCAEVHTIHADHSPFVSAVGVTCDLLEGVARRVAVAVTS